MRSVAVARLSVPANMPWASWTRRRAFAFSTGTPSAEGPNKTKDRQAFGFRTYAPLKIVRAECGWGECPPGAPFQIEFNNPLDVDRFDAAQVVTAPTIERAAVTEMESGAGGASGTGALCGGTYAATTTCEDGTQAEAQCEAGWSGGECRLTCVSVCGG